MSVSSLAPSNTPATTDHHIEISIRGKWVRVPALEVGGKTLIVRGKWIKVASIHDEAWLETEVEDPEACVKRLQERGSHQFRADLFTFTQKLPATLPKYSYPLEWESVAAARTSNFREWWQNLPQETRKNVRRSQKRGVTVAVREFDDDLVGKIVELNNATPMRGGEPNAQYGKDFNQVRKDHSSFLDRSDFICAFFGEELIGLLKLVYRGNIASILNLLPKASHHDKRPANALVAKAVELCAAKGVSHLTYGLFNYGNKRDNPLREFKVRNGFEEILVPRFYVPLTTWGKLSMKLKLHRGLLGILPHRLIMLIVGTRAKWHNLKGRSAGVAQC